MLNQDVIDSNGPAITSACADERLINIAQAEGLTTDNPNDHP
jgi:hypothetical protein